MELDNYRENISGFKDDDLILLKSSIDAELEKRGISFDVGAIGEKVAIEHFNSTPGLPNLLQAPTGAKNVDALSRDGDRYSIKTFKKAKKTGTIYPDDRQPDKQLFEYLTVVKIDSKYQLEAIYRYSWDQFIKVRSWDKRMNAWYVPLSRKKLIEAELLFGENSS